MMPPAPQIDARSAKAIATLDPRAQEAFTRFTLAAKATAAEYGCDYVLIAGNRTKAEQDALYAIGRDGHPGRKLTYARGGYSNHNFGIAGDFGVFCDGKYLDQISPKLAERVHRDCAAHAEGCGLDWGGHWESFPDTPHYEVSTVLSLTKKRLRYQKSGSVLS